MRKFVCSMITDVSFRRVSHDYGGIRIIGAFCWCGRNLYGSCPWCIFIMLPLPSWCLLQQLFRCIQFNDVLNCYHNGAGISHDAWCTYCQVDYNIVLHLSASKVVTESINRLIVWLPTIQSIAKLATNHSTTLLLMAWQLSIQLVARPATNYWLAPRWYYGVRSFLYWG